MKKILPYFLLIFWLFWNIGFLLLSILSLSYNYEEITTQIIRYYEQPEKLGKFRNELFTPQRFFILQITLLSLTFFSLAALFFSSRLIKTTSNYLIEVGNEIRSFFCKIWKTYLLFTPTEKRLFFVLFVLISLPKLYFLFHFPLLLDEAFTFIFFVEKGFFVAAFYYPGPNNHILFSLTGLLFYQSIGFLFSEPVFALRLLSFSAFVFTAFLFFFWLKVLFNFPSAFGGLVFFSFLSPVVLFSFLARGYFLQMFFVLLFTWATYRIATKNENKGIHFIFIGASVLGFYCIPTFIYPFISLLFFLLITTIRSKKDVFFKKIVWDCVLIAGFVFLLYLPVLLFNGLEAIANNSWTKSLNFKDFVRQFPDFLAALGEFFFPNIGWLGLLLFSLLIFTLFFIGFFKSLEGRKSLQFLLLSFFIIPLVILLVQRVLPFERVFSYWAIPLTLSILLITDTFFRTQRIKYLVLVLFCLLSIFSSAFDFSWKYPPNTPQTVAKKALNDRLNHIFINEDAYNIYFRYEYLKAEKDIHIENYTFEEKQNYDLIILDKAKTFPLSFSKKNYRKYLENTQIRAFCKKN